jgi:hypothetical protein
MFIATLSVAIKNEPDLMAQVCNPSNSGVWDQKVSFPGGFTRPHLKKHCAPVIPTIKGSINGRHKAKPFIKNYHCKKCCWSNSSGSINCLASMRPWVQPPLPPPHTQTQPQFSSLVNEQIMIYHPYNGLHILSNKKEQTNNISNNM